ncbi:unnamed protein product [Lactuca saligna]|uniref:Uncharacterized protein n=1 Tax=Lactuca saligna TaxID=75948 RepID=A0AA35VS85_LACSI|nr:unnamed protein product [Lactuca saligna]
MTKSPKQKFGEGVKVLKTLEKPIDIETVEPSKELVPSKSSVLKHLEKKAHRSRNSPERSSSFSPSMVRKPQEDSMDNEVVPESPMGKVSSKKKSLVKLIFKEIGMSSSSVKTSTMGTSTLLGDSIKISTPKQTSVTPPEVLLTK